MDAEAVLFRPALDGLADLDGVYGASDVSGHVRGQSTMTYSAGGSALRRACSRNICRRWNQRMIKSNQRNMIAPNRLALSMP